MCRPVEIHQVQLRPADFFSANPSIDVPSSKNLASKLAVGNENGVETSNGTSNGTNGTSNGDANGSACCSGH